MLSELFPHYATKTLLQLEKYFQNKNISYPNIYIFEERELISNINSYKAVQFFINNTGFLLEQEQTIDVIGFRFRRLQKGIALTVKATQSNVYIIKKFQSNQQFGANLC